MINLSKYDKFIQKMSKKLDLSKIPKIEYDTKWDTAIKDNPDKVYHPDLWINLNENIIYVTKEWERQEEEEKEKRLLHELLHILGYKHGKYGDLEYSTYPAKDSLSMQMYKQLTGTSAKDIILKNKESDNIFNIQYFVYLLAGISLLL